MERLPIRRAVRMIAIGVAGGLLLPIPFLPSFQSVEAQDEEILCTGKCNCYFSSDCPSGQFCNLSADCREWHDNGKLRDGMCQASLNLAGTSQENLAASVDYHLLAYRNATLAGGGLADQSIVSAAHELMPSRELKLISMGLAHNLLDLSLGFDFKPLTPYTTKDPGGMISLVLEPQVAWALVDAMRNGFQAALTEDNASATEAPLRAFWQAHPDYRPAHTGRAFPHGHVDYRTTALDYQIEDSRRLIEVVLKSSHSTNPSSIPFDSPASS